MNTLRTMAAALALGFGLATAAPAFAFPTTVDTNGTQHVTMDTLTTPMGAGIGGFDGTLQLTISRDGIVNGYFRYDNGTVLHQVTGGVDNGQIWLNIWGDQNFHVSGRLDGGRIVGSTILDTRFYNFTATAQKS